MHVGPVGGAVYARRDDVVLREVAGEQLLVPIRNDPDGMQAIFALTGTGVFVWGLLDGERPTGAILAAILERFDVTPEEAEADLNAFIERLTKAGLVERKP
jgi:Coenzyme PQQ synthesis protein D (PqqD)